MSIKRHYATWSDYVTACSKPDPQGASQNCTHEPNRKWDLGAGYDGALKLATKGWPAGCKKVAEIAAEILESVSANITRPVIAYDVEGECVDIGKLVEGEPECVMIWEDAQGEQLAKPVIKIVVNMAISAGIKADVIAMRGAAICALVQALDLAGYPSEIVVATAVDSSYETTVVVKQAYEPVQIDALAFSLGHPSMLRRLWFALVETESPAVRAEHGFARHGGYGLPTLASEPATLTLGMLHYDQDAWHSVATAKAWVLNELKAQGVALNLAPSDEETWS